MAEVPVEKITPTARTVQAAKRTRKYIEEGGGAQRMTVLVHGDAVSEAAIEVPAELVPMVERAIEELSQGRSVELVRIDEELTTQQVADLLNVSRPFVTKLLDRGEIPHHRVGTHRRVYRTDAEAYRDRQMRRAKRAMRAMAEQAEDLGFYD